MTTEPNCEPRTLAWRTSSYSGTSGGDCVEVASAPDATHVRDTKDRTKPSLTFPTDNWTHFLTFATTQTR